MQDNKTRKLIVTKTLNKTFYLIVIGRTNNNNKIIVATIKVQIEEL